MPSFSDCFGKLITFKHIPKRIISVVPSITELLYTLGLEEEVVGITKFCIHPEEWFRTKQRVGGTKKLNIDIIKDLQPDLIIANKEENNRQQIEELAAFHPVWVNDITTLEEACAMIKTISQMVALEVEGDDLLQTITSEFGKLRLHQKPAYCKAVYLIWKEPYMTVGGDTFIHNMMKRAGFQNSFGSQKRYPQLTIEDLKNNDFDVLLLSSEPYPFSHQHVDELQALLPHIKIILVDGEAFSWYGSHLQYAPEYFIHLHKLIEAQ